LSPDDQQCFFINRKPILEYLNQIKLISNRSQISVGASFRSSKSREALQRKVDSHSRIPPRHELHKPTKISFKDENEPPKNRYNSQGLRFERERLSNRQSLHKESE
jgi:hypothetical protein